jgi:hypothetical protein
MALSNNAVKGLMEAAASQTLGNEIATAINSGLAVSAQSGLGVVAAITATSTSTTTDFGALAVGDLVLKVPAVAGNGIFYTVATAGTLPAAATVGALYVVLRAFSLPAATSLVF